MNKALSETAQRRLDVQGFDTVDGDRLASVAPWQRMAFALCATLAGVGTLLASPAILLALVPIAILGALLPIHPFDLIYNHGIRHLRGTGPIPRRGAPSRFACGVGAVWLTTTAWAFWAGHITVGYVLGGVLTSMAVLVSTTDICIASIIFRAVMGRPVHRVSPEIQG